MKEKQPLAPIVAAAVLSFGILVALILPGIRELTEAESVLLGILLTSASIMVSWLVTHIYSQVNLDRAIEQATEANKENIRNYAVKAAEKVLNLSGELKRLSEALSSAIEDSEDASTHKETILILQERISSAVHNIETLRSMNDTFLSDWRGVIGDEIEKQHLLENQISELAGELENQKKERDILKSQFVSPVDLANIEHLISETEQRLTQNLTALPFKVNTRKEKIKKREASVNCPSCSDVISTKFRCRRGGYKLVQCSSCRQYAQLIGLDDEEIQVSPVSTCVYEGDCPLCNKGINAEIADYPGAMRSITCSSCDTSLLVSRAQGNFNIRPSKRYKYDYPQKLIDEIRLRLPNSRPWPTHIHKQIALELGYSNKLVTKVISKLISQGMYPLPDEIEKNMRKQETPKEELVSNN